MVSMWKSQEGYVALVLSVYLYVGSRHSTHIARFVWQVQIHAAILPTALLPLFLRWSLASAAWECRECPLLTPWHWYCCHGLL